MNDLLIQINNVQFTYTNTHRNETHNICWNMNLYRTFCTSEYMNKYVHLHKHHFRNCKRLNETRKMDETERIPGILYECLPTTRSKSRD